MNLHNLLSIGQTDSKLKKAVWLIRNFVKEGMAGMRRNRRNNAKKERIIMIASSAFVLAALTMTGIYMKSNQMEEPDDGYTIDFMALENNASDKLQEIAQNNQTEEDQANGIVQDNIGLGEDGNATSLDEMLNLDDDLDYTPMEVGSGEIELPGVPKKDLLEDGLMIPEGVAGAPEMEILPESELEEAPETEPMEQKETAANNVISKSLHFSEENGLLRPVSGEIIIPFNMNNTVHFYTLNNYKCNPGLVVSADVGTSVTACAAGKVVNIFDNEEIGHAVTMDIGDGYEITYGQLEGINVTQGDYVEAGDVIATVAEPTKYYCVEGSNLYLEMTAGGEPVNPEPLFR